jgi:hypothetical protein
MLLSDPRYATTSTLSERTYARALLPARGACVTTVRSLTCQGGPARFQRHLINMTIRSTVGHKIDVVGAYVRNRFTRGRKGVGQEGKIVHTPRGSAGSPGQFMNMIL